MPAEYDYIVVGSGAAGSVVAARLGDAGHSVCVVEAGGSDNHPFIKIPAGFVKNLGKPSLMWQFETPAGDNTAGRSVYLPQGKVLGGSTSINGLIYNRGWSGDFDAWAAQGNTGWSYQDVLPYFMRAETRDTESQFRGGHGPIRISDPDQHHPVCDAFIEAVVETGCPRHNDYNAKSQRGAGYYQRFIHDGKRETVANAYLKPAIKRGNIEVRTNTLAMGLVGQGRSITQVRVQKGENTELLSARREVILCAGTVNTVRLLELSGIGQGDHLRQLGIPVVHDLPGVGENFQDHYFVRLAARLKAGTSTLNSQAKGLRLAAEVLRYFMGKPSILTWSPSIAYAFINSADPELLPDLQFVFSHGSYKPGKVYQLDDFPAATCGFTQQRPESRGFVHLKSSDPDVSPTVQPNYLTTELDCATTLKGIRLARGFLQSEPLQQWFASEAAPGADLQSDDELLAYARETGNTGYHLVGTCMMGPASNPKAVVGADLKVHGLEGLRIVDASIMPSVTSSNTCAATIMIGEKGADLILGV